MDSKTIREVEKLAEEVPVILEEVESAAEEDAVFEEIEKAKGVAAAFIARYDDLLKPLKLEDQREVLKRLGVKIADIESQLTHLREAPE